MAQDDLMIDLKGDYSFKQGGQKVARGLLFFGLAKLAGFLSGLIGVPIPPEMLEPIVFGAAVKVHNFAKVKGWVRF